MRGEESVEVYEMTQILTPPPSPTQDLLCKRTPCMVSTISARPSMHWEEDVWTIPPLACGVVQVTSMVPCGFAGKLSSSFFSPLFFSYSWQFLVNFNFLYSRNEYDSKVYEKFGGSDWSHDNNVADFIVRSLKNLFSANSTRHEFEFLFIYFSSLWRISLHLLIVLRATDITGRLM